MHKLSRLFALPIATFALLVAAPAAFGATISSSTANPLADGFNNDAECSLREMVAIANADNTGGIENSCDIDGTLGADTIQLQGGTYTLATPIDGTPGINDGDLEVTDADGLTIDGTDALTTLIDGGDHDRILEPSGASGLVTLRDLTVENGRVTSGNGAGIDTDADLTLEDARVRGNETLASGNGAGILAVGAGTLVTLTDSTVGDNSAAGSGGGLHLAQASLSASGASHIDDNTAVGLGGGINGANGAADITLGPGVTVNGNDVTGFGTGAGIAHNSGDPGVNVTLNGAEVNGNHATATSQARGGGIFFLGQGAVQITDSRIQNNTAAGADASGGAIHAGMSAANPLEITRTLISGNSATVVNDGDAQETHGGGALSTPAAAAGTGLVNITGSRFTGNTLTVNDPEDFAIGGAISSNGQLTVDSSTFDANGTAGTPLNNNGGAIATLQPAGPTGIINSTFSGNQILNLGPNSSGGAIFAATGAMTPTEIAHSTFTGNGSADDLAPGESLAFNGTSYEVRASIFAEDGASGCVPGGLPANVPNPDFNIDAGNSCGAAIPNATTNLGPLSDNGGPTPTHALLIGPDSQAINIVPSAQCLDLNGGQLTTDQRGRSRPFPAVPGAPCDAGAYELGDIDGDGIFDTFDACPTQFGPPPGCPVPQTSTPPATEHPDCEPLRQQIRRLSRKIKRTESKSKKAKLKKQRSKARKQLAALGCP